MTTNLLGRTASTSNSNDRAEIVAAEMKQTGGNCFLVVTLLFSDGTLKTVAERDVQVENTP